MPQTPTINVNKYWKFPSVALHGTPAIAAQHAYKASYFFCINDLVYRTTAAPGPAEERRYQKSDSTLLQSVLWKLSFLFCPGSPTMPLNMYKLGLIIIYFISNLYGGDFL